VTQVRLDDLAQPRFSAEAQQILDMMAAMAPNCPLDAEALHAQASADTGLHDFGAQDYRERLDVYLAALREIDGLHAAGVVNFYGQLLQLLKNRLLLADLLSRHPEIDDVELLPPIVIAGLPRTGTTHLHNLLAAAPTFRTMPYWESVEPFPRNPDRGDRITDIIHELRAKDTGTQQHWSGIRHCDVLSAPPGTKAPDCDALAACLSRRRRSATVTKALPANCDG
jgi:hypothetical protein